MSDFFVHIKKDPKHVAKERNSAKALKQTNWWRTQLSRGICHYCKKQFPPDELTMDHLVPVARGGRSTKGNIVPACSACNADKSCLTPVEILLEKMQQSGEIALEDMGCDYFDKD